jgi:hypothetical protein
LSGERVASIDIDGQPAAAADVRPWAFHNAADAGALAALKVPLVAGRWIEHAEEERRARVVLVGEETARKYFGSIEGAVGRRLSLSDQRPPIGLEIVGVVGDVLVNDVERGKVPRMWTTLADARRLSVVVTTRGSHDELASLVRREMASLAPAIPLEQLETIDQAFAHFEASNQIVIGIFAGFAVIAVLLAASGLYGLITYTVSQRTSEFGTRFALGARRGDVLRLVLAQVGRLTGVGLAMGMLAGLAAGYGMRSILFGVSSTDPITIGGVIAVVVLVALLASIRPAIRAARVNLVEALRSD